MSNLRYERKFVITELDLEQVENYLMIHPACFSPIFKERNINNIYFDTPNLNYYHENVSGQGWRKKIRIRWYGDLFTYAEKPTLEIKLKYGLAGDKLSYRLKPFRFDENFDYSVIFDVVRKSNLPPEVLNDFYEVEPALVNRYNRRYFRSADQNFRITVDKNLSYYEVFKHHNRFKSFFIDNKTIVVELKYKIGLDDIAGNISTHFPFRLSKNSKYVNGIDTFRINQAI